MASPNFAISEIGFPSTFAIVAIAVPASPAAISNATPIFAASVANPNKCSRARPACPPAATIAAISSPAIGIVRVNLRMSFSISLNCSGVSKFTTFLTSAIALSN